MYDPIHDQNFNNTNVNKQNTRAKMRVLPLFMLPSPLDIFKEQIQTILFTC